MSDISPENWTFAPLITFRKVVPAENKGREDISHISAALGVRWQTGDTKFTWALRRYVAAPENKPEDQYYNWWDSPNPDANNPVEVVRYSENLGEFDEIVLPNRSWRELRPGEQPGQLFWQHLFLPCGFSFAEQVSPGRFRISFSLRTACGRLLVDAKDTGPLFEVPIIAETGFQNQRPSLSFSCPWDATAQLGGVVWTPDSPAPTRFKRGDLGGEIQLLKSLTFLHSEKGDPENFYWADKTGAADRSRGKVYLTYLKEQRIVWSAEDVARITQIPFREPNTPIPEASLAAPVWRLSVDYGSFWDWKIGIEPGAERKWGEWATEYLSAVKSGLAADSLSFFPSFDRIKKYGSTKVDFSCQDTRGSDEESLQFSVATPIEQGTRFSALARFRAAYGERTDGSNQCGVLSAQVTFRALPRDYGGRPDIELYYVGNLRVVEDVNTALCLRDNAFELHFDPEPPKPPEAAKSAEQPDWGRVRAGRRFVHGCKAGGSGGEGLFVEISRFQLPLNLVRPIAQDATPELRISSLEDYEARDFRADPLVVPLGKAEPCGYRLHIEESLHPPRSRNLGLEIMVVPGAVPSIGSSVVVIDPHPFTVAQVPLENFSFLDNAESGRVLARRVYESDSGVPVWRLVVNTADPDRALTLQWPPQAVGEEALLKKKTTLGEIYDMRLGCSGVIGLETSYFTQRYAPVPWDLRWILGRPGERDTGARVRWMDIELLYGLAARFDADPAGTAIRLAEVVNRLGEWPGGVPEVLPWPSTPGQRTAFNSLRARWGALARLYVARLGIYELWSQAQPGGVVLREGVTIRPRVKAGPNGPIGAQLRDLPGLTYVPPEQDPISAIIPTLHSPTGLPGGFEWGMQEWGEAWIRSFWTVAHGPTGRSSSAQLSGVALSALGGHGHQIARFMKDRIMIEAKVGQGRAHTYTVERVGRIGVFWNKAKHVIRYERSTVPAPEFQEEQDHELGRPILRKVDEYIEILQDRREFPDRKGGEAMHTGPIRACVFPKAGYRIRIRGSWGRSLDRPGRIPTGRWEVSLWQLGANPERFPKPEIHLELLTRRTSKDKESQQAETGTEPDIELAPFSQAIGHPEDVYFYTDGDPVLPGDPGDWKPVADVDFTDQIEPVERPVGDSAAWQMSEKTDTARARFPEALDVAPGMKRFSFRLEPAQDETVVTAHRQAASQVRGRARAVTMMRSMPKVGKPDKFPEVVGARTLFPDRPQDNFIVPASVKAAHATERMLLDARGRAAFGLQETITRYRTDKKPATTEVAVTQLRDDLKNLLPKEKIFSPAAVGGDLACPLQPGDPPIVNPILHRLLLAALGELRDQAVQFLATRLRTVRGQIDRTVAEATSAVGAHRAKSLEALDAQVRFLRDLDPQFSVGFEGLIRGFCEQLDHVLGDARTQIASIFDRLDQGIGSAEAEIEKLATNKAEAVARLEEVRERIEGAFDTLNNRLNEFKGRIDSPSPGEPFHEARAAIARAVGDFQEIANGAGETLNVAQQKAIKNLNDATTLSEGFVREQLAAVRRTAVEMQGKLMSQLQSAVEAMHREAVHGLGAQALGAIQELEKRLRDPRDEAIALLEKVRKEIEAALGETEAQIRLRLNALYATLDGIEANVPGAVETLIRKNLCPLANALGAVDLGLGEIFGAELADLIGRGIDIAANIERVAAAITAKPPRVDEAIEEVCALANRVNDRLGFYTEQALGEVKSLYDRADAVHQSYVGVVQAGEEIVRSARAVAEAFTAPGLGFNRKTVALLYGTGDALRSISTTPIIGRLKELNANLNALGVNLPISGLAEKFLPDISLPKFDLNNIMRDLGGANLTGLFKGLKMPKNLSDAVKISHGVDKESMRAWVKADLPPTALTDPGKRTPVFSLGPVTVSVEGAIFEAHVSMEAQMEGRTQKDARGSITANWILAAGMELVAFDKTKLLFANGKMDFKIEPQNVRMSGLLRILSDVANKLSMQEDGFYIGLMKQGEIPVGMKAVLELPSISAGTTPVAVNSLQLGGFLELRALDENLKFNFTLGAGIHLSRKESPFSIAIFCLGGGGWVDASVRYLGSAGYLEADVGVGLDASASLDINLGVVKGFIRASLGIFCQYQRKLGQASQLLVGVRLMLEGQVDVLGIVEVYLALILEGIYNGKQLIGRGTVVLRIKICWCFTLKVRKSVTYSFGGGSQGGGESQARAADLAAPGAWSPLARPLRVPSAARASLGKVDSYETVALEYLQMIE